ncbi:TPA: Flp pilus assembly complex ATPase component TadA [Salmonella enterica subsp. salamae serovar 35:g,m,s,t:-]|nr:Flp pilus assembly complex ATPase component TadA [Salmonella enterica subsp. salamae serovar 35:g,m,s,t:-]HCA3549675.1 Flp pilus assembly complex ATPase component TadA [Salmonella enterica subsp. salamae serovar 35:g,m,s,t:-]
MDKIIIPAAISEMVFLDDEQFVIADNHKSQPEVQSFYKKMKKLGREATFVPLPVLRQLLNSNGDVSTLSTSENQQTVIELFKQGRALGASDIHLEIGRDGVTQVYFRIHGELEHIDSLEREDGMNLASTIVLSMCDMAEKQFNGERQQDGRVAKKYLEGLDLFGARYAHTPAVYGLYVVMRIIPDDGKAPPTLEQLGFLPEQIVLIGKALKRPEGVIILSGPTGSGKSTTLRSLGAQYTANTRGKKRLLTVEDPPEGKIENAVQTAIVADRSQPEAVSQAWVRAMTSALRLDPDCILVGEIRCNNSAKTAIEASMTGHLILTTLHANDPFNILERLATKGIEPELIADPQLMIGQISQRLVPLLCPHCAKKYEDVYDEINSEDIALIEKYCDTDAVRFRNHDGCEHCRMMLRGKVVSGGIVGRTIIAEVVVPDEQLLSIYRQKGRLAARKYWHSQLNGITRHEHLMPYINAGKVDPLIAHNISPLDEDEVLS